MQCRKRKLQCTSPSCKFEDVKLEQHLRSKSHNLPQKRSALAQSFMSPKKLNTFALVDKHGIPKTAFCQDYHKFNSQDCFRFWPFFTDIYDKEREASKTAIVGCKINMVYNR